MTMERSPPQDTLLQGELSANGQDELQRTRGLERAVAEVAVIAGCDEEHPTKVNRDEDREIDRVHPPHPYGDQWEDV